MSARFYPTQARATGSSWMHGIGRIGAILSAFAGAEMMAMELSFEAVFLLLGIPAAITVVAISAKVCLLHRVLTSQHLSLQRLENLPEILHTANLER